MLEDSFYVTPHRGCIFADALRPIMGTLDPNAIVYPHGHGIAMPSGVPSVDVAFYDSATDAEWRTAGWWCSVYDRA